MHSRGPVTLQGVLALPWVQRTSKAWMLLSMSVFGAERQNWMSPIFASSERKKHEAWAELRDFLVAFDN